MRKARRRVRARAFRLRRETCRGTTVRWRDERLARGEINTKSILARYAFRATFNVAEKGEKDARTRRRLFHSHCALGGALLLLAGVWWFRQARREASVGARASRRTQFGP